MSDDNLIYFIEKRRRLNAKKSIEKENIEDLLIQATNELQALVNTLTSIAVLVKNGNDFTL